ncbi:hypothetical protein ACQ4PT_050854 [Festuca glaucescens]
MAFLYLLHLLFACVFRPHRRGCLHARFPWEDSFRSAAGQSSLALAAPCSCHQIMLRGRHESSTAGRRRASLLSQPASQDCSMTMFSTLYDYMRWLRSTATFGSADLHASLPWRDAGTGDGIEQPPREGWSDDFHAGVDIIHTSPYTYTYDEDITASRRRDTANGRRTTSRRPAGRELVELSTSTSYPDDDRYGLPDNEHLSTSDDESVLELCLDLARCDEVLDRCFPQGFFIDHGNIEFNELSERWWCQQLWQDDGSHDYWRDESCIDSTPDAVSELHDGSCLDQDSVCSDYDADSTDSDANSDTDTHTDTQTLHGTATTSTALVNFVRPRSADSDTAASLSKQLGGGSDASCWTTEQQPGDTDDLDDSDSVHSSITTEELLVRQSDDAEETEVSMAQEQASQTPNGSDDGTSGGTPSWSTAGFRFLPTDKDIVLYYLKRKVLNQRLPVYHTIEERHDIYALDADEITLDENYGDEERLGFFFVQKQYAYNNGCYYRTPDGYWRIRGRPTGVNHRGRTVGFKTAMDFHRGRPPHGCRTPWSMFEYALNPCQGDLLNLAQPWVHEHLRCVQGSLEGEQNVAQRKEVASPRTVAETPFSEENIAETLRNEEDLSRKEEDDP